jgi:hypothetical protein
MSFFNVCLRIPNMGIILFYIIFIILIPIYLIYTDNTDAFNYYFPAIVMLAIVITEAGKPNDNQNLYPVPAENLQGFVSTNIINGLAIAAILYQAVAAAVHYNSVPLGVALAFISFLVVFPIAQQLLPFFIRQGDIILREKTTFLFPGNWHKYFLGFLFIIVLLLIQNVVIMAVSEQIFSASKSGDSSSGSNANNKGATRRLNTLN